MGIFGEVVGALVRNATGETAIRKAEEKWAAQQANYSLSCNKCGALAEPIPQTGNRYKCCSCGRQFAGAKHRGHTLEEYKAHALWDRKW